MQKEAPSLYQLLVSALFVGILLSFALFYMIHAQLDHDKDAATHCMDGSVIEDESAFDDLNRAVYQNAGLQNRILEDQFVVLGVVSKPNVIAGRNNFLFAVENTDYDYNYLEDYLGYVSFSDKELAAILAMLERRSAAYEAQGAEYMLVVIPNAQTVYSENMPAYLGGIGTTRLDRLEEYLAANGYTDFLNLSDDLSAKKAHGPLYNNTENSLNALGAYYTYYAVCNHFPDSVVTPRLYGYGELDFRTHETVGKTVARAAELEQVVPNLTVSLSNNTKLNYTTVYADGRSITTERMHEDAPLLPSPVVMLQFTEKWDRLLCEPFFSNTFDSATYQTNLAYDAATMERTQPDIVIQFVYEYQLGYFLQAPHS